LLLLEDLSSAWSIIYYFNYLMWQPKTDPEAEMILASAGKRTTFVMFTNEADEAGQFIKPIVQDLAKQYKESMIFVYCDIDKL
jgi:hypothetical protein